MTAVTPRRHRIRAYLLFALLLGAGIGGHFAWKYWINSNFAVVIPGKVYRSGQPRQEQLRSWINEYHIKTIINLRGSKAPDCQSEAKLAAEMNVTEVPIALSARRPMTKVELTQLIEALEKAHPPLLLHCQGGNDRSGAAAMLAMLANGSDYLAAKKQLYVPLYGRHISETIAAFDKYRNEKKVKPDWTNFKKWAATVYDPGITIDQATQPAE